MQNNNDDRLWQTAKARANFKRSVFSYLVINTFLWAIWYVTAGRKGINTDLPWPVWPTLGWGLGLAFQYFKAYNGDKDDLAIKEYERLKEEQNR